MKVNVVDKRGKVVGLHPKVAQVLVGKGTVRYAAEPVPIPAVETKVVIAEPAAAEPVVSESVAEAVSEEPESEEPEISPRTGLPKRQYRRRDMQAE